MDIIGIKELPENTTSKSLKQAHAQIVTLRDELNKKELPRDIIDAINEDIEEINSTPDRGKKHRKLLEQKYSKILAFVKKELHYVPRYHHLTLWMAIGMAAFGLPLGVLYGQITDNMGLLTLGLPVGLGIGILIGVWLDTRVEKEGRQLKL